MDLSNLLQGAMGATIVSTVASKLGIEDSKAKTVIAVGLPLLLTAMKKKADQPDGANGILNAINNKHDGGILDNLSNFLGGESDEKDGHKILGHVFGGSEKAVADNISEKSGIDAKKVIGMLAILAPIVLALVGRNAKNNSTDSNGLSGLIGGILGGNKEDAPHSNELNILEQLLGGGSGNASKTNQGPDLMDIGSKLLGNLFNK